LAGPTLANLDTDADLEVVLNTAHAGFVAYDLPGASDARVLWSTGRGNFERTGLHTFDPSIPTPVAPTPTPTLDPTTPSPAGDQRNFLPAIRRN
jgi:hypothetical protein